MSQSIKFKIPEAKLSAATKKLAGMKDAFEKDDANSLAIDIIKEIKNLISKGISPLMGMGRYRKYSENYPQSVQKDFPDKKKRPVNLYLSGEMLSKLRHKTFKAKNGHGIELFFDSESARNKAKWNAETERPPIPSDANDFAASIQRLIFKAYRDAIAKFSRR